MQFGLIENEKFSCSQKPNISISVMYSSCHLPIWPTDPWRSLIAQENSCYVRVPLAVRRIIILKILLGLYLVKIPGLLAWLIFDLSLFEQQLLLSPIPSIPVVSNGTMLTPGAES